MLSKLVKVFQKFVQDLLDIVKNVLAAKIVLTVGMNLWNNNLGGEKSSLFCFIKIIILEYDKNLKTKKTSYFNITKKQAKNNLVFFKKPLDN